MNARLSVLVWVPVAPLFFGCSHAPRRPTPSTDPPAAIDLRTYPAPEESVWTAVLAALADIGYLRPDAPLASRTVESDWIEVQAREASRGGGLLGAGERRESGGTLGAIADLPETKGAKADTLQTTGRDGNTGVSIRTRWGHEIGLWTRCRHRLFVSITPSAIDTCSVEARAEIECWEKQKRKAWTRCASRGRLEADFFAALEARLAARTGTSQEGSP